jgi:hypothetical protein
MFDLIIKTVSSEITALIKTVFNDVDRGGYGHDNLSVSELD